jgi:hypothetical protein
MPVFQRETTSVGSVGQSGIAEVRRQTRLITHGNKPRAFIPFLPSTA